MTGTIIWFSKPEGIGYVMREGKRQAYSQPMLYFFNEQAFPEMKKLGGLDVVGQKVSFETMFSSSLDEDVVKTMRLL